MSQLNVYVPDDLEKKIRQLARKSGKSVSKFIVELFSKQQNRKAQWQKDFFRMVIGKWQGDFPEVRRDFAENRQDL